MEMIGTTPSCDDRALPRLEPSVCFAASAGSVDVACRARYKPPPLIGGEVLRRSGRAAEGAPLLREYGGNSIAGSNPAFSAICSREGVVPK